MIAAAAFCFAFLKQVLNEEVYDERMGWDLFLFCFWALSFEIIKSQPLIESLILLHF